MRSKTFDFALAIGGAAGDGVATPGNILARLFIRRGLHIYAYNAYQSIIRGGHIFLTVRVSDQQIAVAADRQSRRAPVFKFGRLPSSQVVSVGIKNLNAGLHVDRVNEIMTSVDGDRVS